jgi:hypothetical protein
VTFNLKKQKEKNVTLCNSDSSEEQPNSLNSKTKTTILKYSCDDVSEPEFYSNYLVKFEDYLNTDSLKQVSEIKLSSHTMSSTPVVTDESNSLSIVYGNEMKVFTFENGSHEINELLESINDALEENDVPVKAKMAKDSKITFESDESFGLDCTENSITKFLGFTKPKYSLSSKYTSEKHHVFNSTPLYIYILNISKTKPFAVIKPSGKVEHKFGKFDKPIGELKYLVIQIKDTESDCEPDDTDDLHEFNSPHSMQFEFKYFDNQ